MFDIKKIFTTEYFFGIDRVMLHRSDWGMLVLGGVLVFAAIVVKLWSRKLRKQPVRRDLSNRFYSLLLTIGLLEVLWFGFRYQNIRWFGTHFTALLVFIIGLVWLGYLIKYYRGKYRTELRNWEAQQTKQKYLSKR